MDIVALQEAKKLGKKIGNTETLKTNNKIIVDSINELVDDFVAREEIGELVLYEQLITNVDTDEVRTFWVPLARKGFIKGIKCTGNEHTGDFNLSIFTKNPTDGGRYIYKSGNVNNILWDIMDIPFSSETGTNDVYAILENKGILTTFNLQIYVMKG